MRCLLFSAWRKWDQYHTAAARPFMLCPMCPPEGSSQAILVDPGLGEDEAMYQCIACDGHLFAEPHYLNWPSYKTRMRLGRWRGALIVFITVALPWRIRRWRLHLSTCLFGRVYQLAHRCTHWSIVTMRQDYQGNVIGHTLLSRLIRILAAILFSLSLPHVQSTS